MYPARSKGRTECRGIRDLLDGSGLIDDECR
jgi:hypothetical protein